MTTLNQKEYLKKYLGIGKGSGLKKKKIKSGKVLGKSLKIIDDDVDAALSKEIQDDLANLNEDAPQIVAVIDDRPPSLRIDEKTKDNLWKPIGQVTDSDSHAEDIKFSNFRLSKEIGKLEPNLVSTYSKIKKDFSPSKKRKQLDYDYSPTRVSSKNQSPSRKSKWDVSPPLNIHEDIATRIKVEQDDISSPKRIQRSMEMSPTHYSEGDMSPPRNSKCNVLSGQNSRDMSPPRKVGSNKDYSPQRKSRKPNFELSPQNSRDISPSRQVKRNDSPHRKMRETNSSSYSRRSPRKNKETRVSRWNRGSPRKTENDDNFCQKTMQLEKIEKTLSGKKSGLQNAKDLAQEIITIRQNEEVLFNNMSNEISGQNAMTISRKKKTEVDVKEIENKKELEVKYSKWGRGIKQVQDTLEKNEDMLQEMNKPLARYADDEDLEKFLKKQERDGDPMLAYIRKKKKKKQVEAGIPEKPMYMGDFGPNRFGIQPGYRWDGVDRSNGYEKKLFESKNSKKADEEDAMKWSTEDM